jgi:hypothetical protein
MTIEVKCTNCDAELELQSSDRDRFQSVDPELVELLTMLRHYGNARFLMLPIFLSIQFALFLALDQSRELSINGDVLYGVLEVRAGKAFDSLALFVLPIAGIVVSLCFCYFEYLQNGYITTYRLAARNVSPDGSELESVLNQPTAQFQTLPWVMGLLYFGPIFFWASLYWPTSTQ